MNMLPDPLHPAIVHFPIVLILLGAVIAVLAVLWRKHALPLLAGVVLTLAVLGAWGAMQTGESAEESLKNKSSPEAQSLLAAHEHWAKRTMASTAVAAAAALVAAGLFRFPKLSRAVAVLAAAAAVAASYSVYQTGHRGGTLVFKHGAGVAVSTTATGTVSVHGEESEHR